MSTKPILKLKATMVVPEVLVEIRRHKSGFLSAKVYQEDASGGIRGKNMLAGQQIRSLTTAQREVQDTLRGKVGQVIFTFEDY